jgi:hypothetical protein
VLAARLTIQAPALPLEQGRSRMTASHLSDNSFIGIDVGGASLDVAWHRGDSAHYANRPDAIAMLVERLQAQPEVTRIVLEPTGGYEKPLVKALRQAQLPVEVIIRHALRPTANWSASKPSPTPRMLGCWQPMPPLLTMCVGAKPIASNCRKMRSARHLANSQVAAIRSNI